MTTPTTTQALPRATAAAMAVYEAFGRGDLDGLLALLSEDVSWDADWRDYVPHREGVAHLSPRRGRGQVAEFLRWFGTARVHEFTVTRVFGDDMCAVGCLTVDYTVPGMARLRDEELHLWTIGPDGLITSMRHYVDTAKHIEAVRAGG